MAKMATTGLVFVGITAVTATRYPWWDRSLPSARVMQVEVPAIPGDGMVIFLDPYAMSYTAPFLPPSVRVIGANTNLVHPGDAGLLQQRIEAAIRTHQGPLWGMEDKGDYPGVAELDPGLLRAEASGRLRADTNEHRETEDHRLSTRADALSQPIPLRHSTERLVIVEASCRRSDQS